MTLRRWRGGRAALALVTTAMAVTSSPARAQEASKGSVDEPTDISASRPSSSSSAQSVTMAPMASGGAISTEISKQAISVPQGAGKIDGLGESFSTELSTGTALLSVALSIPAPRGALPIALALNYASSGGHGVAGVGWSLGGAATISRQTTRGLPAYDDRAAWHPNQDRFVFGGGAELVPICTIAGTTCAGALAGEVMPAWASGWQYFRSREGNTSLRFFWSADHRTWRVQTGGGTMEFGVPLDGSGYTGGLETDPQSAARIFAWSVVREFDNEGGISAPVNVTQYRYATVSGVSYLADVYMTPPAANAAIAPVKQYAHHIRFRYAARPDPEMSFRRGWLTQVTQRLVGVDVSSAPFANGPTVARQLLRRYALTYDPSFHVSLLATVQLEGRCASAIPEDANESLPASTGCPTLPASKFAYTHVSPAQPIATAPGFEPIDGTLHAIPMSPALALGTQNTDLFDIDADSLPDVLVASTSVIANAHAVFLNSGAGGATFAQAAQPVNVQGPGDASAFTLVPNSNGVFGLDVDGNAAVDLVHVQASGTYSVYAAQKSTSGTGWLWNGRSVPGTSTSIGLNLLQQGPSFRLADVNADGFVDLVQTLPNGIQTYFALGRYPGGADQFGQATWNAGGASATLTSVPVTACVPVLGQAVSFADPAVYLTDMNGDSLPDIVRVRTGDIEYWPGRGNGSWGAGPFGGCLAGAGSQMVPMAMASSPAIAAGTTNVLRFDDINADGRADLIQIAQGSVTVWLNVDARSWSAPIAIGQRSTNPDRVRIADINGTGSPDLLWGQAGAYTYVDPLSGTRPWLLKQVDNGLGHTFSLEYASSSTLMVAAAQAGNRWASVIPTPVHVVTRTTSSTNVAVGQSSVVPRVTEYTYRDPVYDGQQRAFVGFRAVAERRLGDANSPTSVTETKFLTGDCLIEGATAQPACGPADRWRDNPREILRAVVESSELHDEAGHAVSTTHSTYRMRQLYLGLDGREVRDLYARTSDSYLYDPTQTLSDTVSVAVPEIERVTRDGTVTAEPAVPLSLRSATRIHYRSDSVVDVFGHTTAATEEGCIEGCTPGDEPITTKAVFALTPGDTSGWTWREVESYVTGQDPAAKRHHVFASYDSFGHATDSQVELIGTLPLDRFHEVAGAKIGGVPANAASDGARLQVLHRDFDAFGHVTLERTASGRCHGTTYDKDYGDLTVTDTTYTGAAGPNGCGTTALSLFAWYDRGLRETTILTEPGGATSFAKYDGFGRIVEVDKPSATVVGVTNATAAMSFEYLVTTNAALQPYSIVHTKTHDGLTDSDASYSESYVYEDGLGGAIVGVSQADPQAGDTGSWVVSGITETDAKGAPTRTYLPYFTNEAPTSVQFHWTGTAPGFVRQSHDAFGHDFESFGLTGVISRRYVFHTNTVDIWDGADLVPGGTHANTPSTMRIDGHGRIVSSVVRFHGASGAVESSETQTSYLVTGEPSLIVRSHVGDAPIARWFRYDSMSRPVLNVDPDTTKNFSSDPATTPSAMKAWRYAWSIDGALVGTSDANGCGTNYYYDLAGRSLAQDYSPCKATHAPYSPINLVTGVGAESFNRYDTIDPDDASLPPSMPASSGSLLGNLVSSVDRATKGIIHYDARGRAVAVARRLAKPGAPDPDPTARFTSRWYVQSMSMDDLGRPIRYTTGGVVPELLGASGKSEVVNEYTRRGFVRDVTSSYGTLLSAVQRDALGRPVKMQYGDAALTTTALGYDALARLAVIQTDRAKAPAWSVAGAITPAGGTNATTEQLVIENTTLTYDEVGNPISIRDGRTALEWPAGAQPVDRAMQYDDMSRLTRIDYKYAGVGDDSWVSPLAAEDSGVGQNGVRRAAPRPQQAFTKRVRYQTYAYDWKGNITSSDDDSHGFLDRSLGTASYGGANAGPYELLGASNRSGGGGHPGDLAVLYDAAGQMTDLAVTRSASCMPTGSICSQRYHYTWDEVGHLARAQRWDLSFPGSVSLPVPEVAANADLVFAYDSAGQRILKTASDRTRSASYTAYIFDSLELHRAQFVGGDYEDVAATEVVYLASNGQRLGRVVYDDHTPRLSSSTSNQHVFLELTDFLGSAGRVIDHETSELVEWTTYTAYGATESDYRTDRWDDFREERKFTGKEEDIEVGLTYFGARYLSSELGRWISADPLAIHSLGADLNAYAYVHGSVLSATDPTGLKPEGEQGGGGVTVEEDDGGSGSEGWWKFKNFVKKVGEAFSDAGKKIGDVATSAWDRTKSVFKPKPPMPGDSHTLPWYHPGNVAIGLASVLGGGQGGEYRETGGGTGSTYEVKQAPPSRGGSYFASSVGAAALVVPPPMKAAAGALWSIGSELTLKTASGIWSHMPELYGLGTNGGGSLVRGGGSSVVRDAIETHLGESLAGKEFFLHGTSSVTIPADGLFKLEPGKQFFTTTDPSMARLFGLRTVEKLGDGELAGLAIVLPQETVQQLRALGQLTVRPVSDMPHLREWVFQPGAHEFIQRSGDIIVLPPGTL